MKHRRRGNGEGSIYQRQDGRWVGVVDLGWRDGKRRRKHLYGKTRREVAIRVAATLRDDQQGLPPPDDRVTVEQFFVAWLAESCRSRLRPRTFDSYSMIVHRHLLPALGKRKLIKLAPDDVQSYLNAKQRSGLSARTVQYHHAVLRACLEQATRWGRVPRNVAKLVSPPRVEREPVKPLSTPEARKFLDAVKDDRLAALYALTLTLGLRQGEALAIRWSDVDLDEAQLRIQHSLQRRDGEYRLDHTKTARSRRVVPLPDPIVHRLRQHRKQQITEQLRAGPLWSNQWDLVFTTETGRPLYGTAVTRRFQRQLAEAGLPRQRFHDLRHAAASFMLAEGVPLRAAMETLGHSNITVTANTYSHVMPELQRDAAERVGKALFG